MMRHTPWAGVLLAFLSVGAASAQTPRLVVKGFINTTAYAQSAAFGFGNGQNALWVKASGPAQDRWLLSTDIRNSRVTFELDGGQLTPATRAAAALEFDFFGGFSGASAFSDEQPLPRLRLAYVDLQRGGTTLRVGQAWTPIVGNLPVSTSRLAFPLGLGSAGIIGWRSPGIYVLHTLGTVHGARVQLHAGAFRGSWSGPGDVLDQQSAGEASGVPQVEAKLELSGRRAVIYAAAHYDRKDLGGMGPDTAELGQLTGSAMAAGARLALGALTLHGNAYRGRAIGQQMGQLAQFGDIGGWGGWVQGSWRVTPRWSASLFAGMDDPADAEVLRELSGDARLANRLGAVMVQYAVGDYSAGVEWIGARTDWGRAGSDLVTRRSAHQLALSVLYRFNTNPPQVQ